MRYKKTSKLAVVLSFVLAGALTMGAAAAGAYPGPAKAGAGLSTKKGTHSIQNTPGGSSINQAERYYKAGSLPLFEIAFSRLNEKEQAAWLEKLYDNDDFAFFSAAVRALNEDDSLIAAFAEKAYVNGEIAFFSTLTDCMDETELELWLDRALEDGRWNFQSMLFDKLDMDDEKDAQEKEWAEQQIAEYRAVGVTKDGKDYYYQGKLVNIFLDTRPNKSFYTLDVNPAGTVNIKIIRSESGQITGVSNMTEAEVTELLDANKISNPSVVVPDEQHTNISPSSQPNDDWKDDFDWNWDWDWGDEDEKDKKWDDKRKAEYQTAGITVDGKNYYYQGQLVNIFMDIRANNSFYTLNMNPAGTVSIKIIRDVNDKITDVTYMTEAEVAELLDDMA